MPCDLGWSWANIHGSSVSWLVNTKMSMQTICSKYVFILEGIKIPYFRKYFPQKQFFIEFGLMYCDKRSQYIKVGKLFKGGNYSKVETI